MGGAELNVELASRPERARALRSWPLGIALSLLLVAALGGFFLWRSTDSARRAAYLHAARGVEQARAGKTPDALREFQTAVRLDPGNPHAWYLLGKTQFEQNPRQALDALGRAARGAPQVASYSRLYGTALLENGKIPEARAELSRAVRLDPSDVDAHIELARAQLARLQSRGDLESAIRELHTALELEPGDIQARFRLGRALFQDSQFAAARGEFETDLTLLARGAEVNSGWLDGRSTNSLTWLSLVKGCHYYLMQIAYRLHEDAAAQEHRRYHEALVVYMKEAYNAFSHLNSRPSDTAAQDEVRQVLKKYGLPPGGADGKAACRRWIGATEPRKARP